MRQPVKKDKTRASGKRSPRRKPLARPGDPLVTKEGGVVQPDSLRDHGLADPRPLDVVPEDFRAQRRSNMDDLPADSRIMNACAAVLAYTMLGISDREIQIALSITEDQLHKVRQHEGYSEMFTAFSEELINVNSDSLQARLAGMAHGALSNVAVLAVSARKEETKLTANRDILDRAGTKVADLAQRNKGAPVGLRITVTEEGGTTIDVTNVNMGV